MSNNNGIVQTQWSIDNRTFVVANTLREVARAVRQDEAQFSAVMAFSALGSSILVSPERINDGLDALDTRGRYFGLEHFAIRLGLHTGGIATLIRNELKTCVPAFLLATSLKTMLDDSAIGAVLFEMLALQGLAKNADLRSSRRDLTAIVSALSGSSDTIVPTQVVKTIEHSLRRFITDPRDLNLAFLQPDSKQIAEVYSRVFGFLQDEDNMDNIIVLRGITSCIAIASLLIWLREDAVSLAIDDTTIMTSNSSRIVVDIRMSEQGGHWMIQEWHDTKSVTNVVVKREENGMVQKLPTFVPVSAARAVVRAQYSLNDAETELVGNMAAALVELALEKCHIMSDATYPGIAPREWSSSRSGLPVQQISTEVAEAACYMAAESTYSATCTKFAQNRYFRTGQFEHIAENAMHILHSVFSDELVAVLRSSDPSTKPKNMMHHMNKITVSQFRAQAMASLLPGATMAVGYTGTHDSGISGRDLIYATNGYIAMASSIDAATTQRSDCMAVKIFPGYIRWDYDDISMQRLIDPEPRGDEGVETTPASSTLHSYNAAGQYIGLMPRQDPESVSVKHHLSVDKRVLSISTSLFHPGTNTRVRVDWMSSMEAIIMAHHVDTGALPAFIEQNIAEDWKSTDIWRTIGWTTASGRIVHKQGTPIRYVSQTYGNEELRFFLAGRRSTQRLFVRQRNTPLVTCIQKALDYEESSGESSRTASEPRPAWIRPDMEEQMRVPGWLIIS
ncbi:hypothetical protein P171DRAFT_470131 [Karstenula rhodostoma CBS 690.94]|uniref:Uncharacterized protein n=1 Tax=Karstenula rhodostoma CBS 690.94 TaxID=1392251 RepID=A0A9P4PNF2_9PLEO|nr:hypothetical protein P171DRAFT_470131 [Karstenula rhodostoma CBS 690.94]